MAVTLQRRGRAREAGETGAFNFQRWLAECRARRYRVFLAYNEYHAYAEPRSD